MKADFIRCITLVFTCLTAVTVVSCAKKDDAEEFVEEPITFDFYNTDCTQEMPFTDPVAKEITRRTGVTLNVIHPRASTNQDIPIMLTDGDFHDMIYVKGEMLKLINANVIVALDDYVDPDGVHHNLIEEYGQNFKKIYGDQFNRLKHTDGHIYSFGTYEIKKAANETSGNFQLQHAVLKELGYPKITTLDEYANAIRAYKAKHPTINGKPTIGFSLLLDTWQWLIDFSNPANYVIGYPDDGQWIVDRNTHKAQYKFFVPETSIYYRWLNELYHDGTLDPESFTQSEDLWKSKIASGQVLGIAYPSWGYVESRRALIQNNMPERTFAYLAVTAAPEYKDPSLTDYGYSGGWGICIPKTCKDVIRCFKFMDWMCSEEAQILLNWGIENRNYIVVDGKRQIPEEEQKRIDADPEFPFETGIEKWVYPFPEAGSGAVDSNGDWISKSSRQRIIDTYLDVEKETLKAYGAETWTDLFPQPEDLPKPLHGQMWQLQLPSEVSAKISEADDYVRGALIECVICDPDDFDKNWNKMISTLKKMGVEETNDQVTQLVKEKLILWGIE